MDITRTSNRKRFVDVARSIKCKTAVEIGVKWGWYSKRMLRAVEGDLYLVDPWMHFESGYEDHDNVSQASQDSLYADVVARFRDKPNVHIVRKTSVDAAKDFSDGSIDWVYIDANHSYESTSEDLSIWWPKVRSGGLFSGDDYMDGVVGHTLFGVKRAVDEFMTRHGLPIPIPGNAWMVIKP
jgi:predicted O-methyltransferase YrrM